MGKRTKSKAGSPEAAAPAAAPFNNPFAGLGGLARGLPETSDATVDPPQPATPVAPAPADSDDWSVGGKVVLRYERKGHGGKPITAVSGLVLRGVEPETLARALAKRLGCHARLDGDRLVLAGDQRERAAEFLRSRGAKQLILA